MDNKKLFYFKNDRNFGDWLGPYIYDKLSSTSHIYGEPSDDEDQNILLMCGSIIQMGKLNSIVCGAGLIFGDATFAKPKQTICVRGKLTRKRFLELGYECPEIYGDPGILMPRLYNKPVEKKYKIALIPHLWDYNHICGKYHDDDDIAVVNLTLSDFNTIENIIDKINMAEKTVSSSLHGIVISHAYGIPCLWAKFNQNLWGDGVKFHDYFSYYDISNQIVDMRSDRLTVTEIEELFEKQVQPEFPINTELLWDTFTKFLK